MTTEPDLRTLIATVQKAYQPFHVDVEPPYDLERLRPISLVLTPDNAGGVRLNDLTDTFEKRAAYPAAIIGTAQAETLESLMALVSRHAEEHSALFLAGLREGSPSLTAVIDYHDATPRHGRHRIVYDFPLSREWLAWTGPAGKFWDQQSFAEHITGNVLDLIDPLPGLEAAREEDVPPDLRRLWQVRAALGGRIATRADMVQLASGLEIHVDSTVKGKLRLESGEQSIAFEEAHRGSDGAPVRIPTMFLLSLPVFHGGAPYLVACRLRYRIKDGRVVWAYDMMRADLAREDALLGAARQASTTTGLPLYLGHPEK